MSGGAVDDDFVIAGLVGSGSPSSSVGGTSSGGAIGSSSPGS